MQASHSLVLMHKFKLKTFKPRQVSAYNLWPAAEQNGNDVLINYTIIHYPLFISIFCSSHLFIHQKKILITSLRSWR